MQFIYVVLYIGPTHNVMRACVHVGVRTCARLHDIVFMHAFVYLWQFFHVACNIN